MDESMIIIEWLRSQQNDEQLLIRIKKNYSET